MRKREKMVTLRKAAGGRMHAATPSPRIMPRISGISRHCNGDGPPGFKPAENTVRIRAGTIPKPQRGTISAFISDWGFIRLRVALRALATPRQGR